MITETAVQQNNISIALIGYGKMGKAIEQIVLQRHHQANLKIDISNLDQFTSENLSNCDVVIEFTGPETAPDNILRCLKAGIPVVSGSTGWLARWDEITQACKENNGTLLYASNFSIGVNIFFEINKQLAKLMNPHTNYEVGIKEIHHTAKKDAPSGTAITLAEGIIDALDRKNAWVKLQSPAANEIEIVSERIDPAPGTHIITYHSAVDDIEIIHTAHSREGFALGAVLAAEFIVGKKGIFNMKDVLGI
jgi:4-hydroxy-tetrahydrodipicolinate reductase